MSLAELLKYFKENESLESIVALADSEDLRNGVVAWKSVDVKFVKNEQCDEKTEAGQWNWMWTQVQFNLQMFAVVSGCPKSKADELFIRLKGLRLIYPDATINSYAAKFIQAQVMKSLPKQK
jgi:hypothetical protein